MPVEILQEEHGFTYRVGHVYQPFNPNKEGFVPMTEEEEEATQLAEECRQRLE